MNPAEIAQMLTYAKTLDQRLRIPEDRDERNLMATAWAGLLAEVPPTLAKSAVDRHYRHSSDTITANVILTHWRNQKSRDAYAANYGDGGRVCTVSACSCTHTECTRGWMDDDDIVFRNGRQYVTASRCPKCAEYLGEIKRERESSKPW
jgi:hypothetical protein